MSRNTSVFNAASLVFGIIFAVCAFLSRMLSGSPIDMVHKLDGLQMLPPIWIFNFLCVAWYFAIGAASQMPKLSTIKPRPKAEKKPTSAQRSMVPLIRRAAA